MNLNRKINRKNFLKTGGMAAAGLGLGLSATGCSGPDLEPKEVNDLVSAPKKLVAEYFNEGYQTLEDLYKKAEENIESAKSLTETIESWESAEWKEVTDKLIIGIAKLDYILEIGEDEDFRTKQKSKKSLYDINANPILLTKKGLGIKFEDNFLVVEDVKLYDEADFNGGKVKLSIYKDYGGIYSHQKTQRILLEEGPHTLGNLIQK
ncbi:twin-arginine translocation signal domain-containing protein [Bacteroidota bacterium]